MHYFDAHSPYIATSWTDTRLDNYEGIYGQSVSVSRFGMGYWIGDPADTHAIRTLYDGSPSPMKAHTLRPAVSTTPRSCRYFMKRAW